MVAYIALAVAGAPARRESGNMSCFMVGSGFMPYRLPRHSTPSTHAKQFDRPARDARALAHRRLAAVGGFRPAHFAAPRPLIACRGDLEHDAVRGAGSDQLFALAQRPH